jgi:hypothetical protein
LQSASDVFEDFNASDRLLRQVGELEELNELTELLMKSCKVLAKVLANPCQTISQATLARTPDLLQSDPTLETVFVSFLFVIKRLVDSFRSERAVKPSLSPLSFSLWKLRQVATE